MTGQLEARPIIGVLGGMGPAATADFYLKLIARTPARVDQDHLRVLIWSDPSVPDRSRALSGDGPNPTPWLRRGAEILRDAGATLIAIPCNTAHAFLTDIVDQLGIPVLDMIEEVARHVSHQMPVVRRVGILATSGTINTGLYQRRFEQVGVETVVPAAAVQRDQVDVAIRDIKAGIHAGDPSERLSLAGDSLVFQGAQVVIAGCTEIPLGLPPESAAFRVVDSTALLAEAVIRRVL